MAAITPNMGLTKWDLSSDPYDHSQLAANWGAIDLHDHSPGKGVKIGSTSIQNNAIITALIATGAVTTAQILDGTITSADISTALFDLISPLGSIMYWWRPNNSVPDPETNTSGRWVLADGRTLTTAQHDYDTAYGINTSIVIPDARNRYPLGAVLAGGGTSTGISPNVGALVGSHVLNLNHIHTVSSHVHTVGSHSHTVNSHAHNVSSHSHPIVAGGLHHHQFYDQDTGTYRDLYQRGGATSVGSNFQASYIQTLNQGQNTSVPAPMETTGSHDHGGSTSASSTTTDSQSPGTNSVGLTTDSSAPNTANPSPDLSATDNRPGAVGFACYVKVKY